MVTGKRFTLTNSKNAFQEMKCGINDRDKTLTFNDVVYLLNELSEENDELKRRINSRLHFYRELYKSTNDDVVKRVIEDLEDILR